MARSVFFLSGGALTVSIGLFAKNSAPNLPQYLINVLATGWYSLFASIIVLCIALTVIIARDYFLGERWRKAIHGGCIDASGRPGWFDIVIWVLGIAGLVSFLVGMFCLAYVSVGVLELI